MAVRPNYTTGFSRYVTHKIFTNYNENERPELLQIVSECIARVNNRNNKRASDSGITPTAIKKTTKDGLEIKFKNINDVYMFLMELFADYNHDIGSIKLINQKLNVPNTHENINCRGLNNTMSSNMKSFTKWLCKINWIESSIKQQLVNLAKGGLYENILDQSFGERGGKKINEYGFVKGVFQEYMLQGNFNEEKIKTLPFTIVKPKDVVDVIGDPSTRISFDQSSRASGPLFYGILKNSYKFDVALPFLADKGASQTSNPLTEFFTKVKEFVNAKEPDKNGKRKQIIDDLSMYIINDNDTFPIRFSLDEKKFFEYTYSYGGGEIINMTFNTFSKVPMVGRSLSAENLKNNNTSVSKAIFKTATDLGMQMYAIAANSIYVSGDRAAGTIIMTLFHMWSRNLINLGGKLPRFVFEISTNTVLVPDEKYFKIIKFKHKNGANKSNQKLNFLTYIYGLNKSGRLKTFKPGRGKIPEEYEHNNDASQYEKTPNRPNSVNMRESLGPAPGGNEGNNNTGTSRAPRNSIKFMKNMYKTRTEFNKKRPPPKSSIDRLALQGVTGKSNNIPPQKTPRGISHTASAKPLKTVKARPRTATAKLKPMTARTATAKLKPMTARGRPLSASIKSLKIARTATAKLKPMTARGKPRTVANSTSPMNATPSKRKRPIGAFTPRKKPSSLRNYSYL